MRRDYDAIVVGSGFGGGVAACRLAEAGQRVCVLERGRRFGRGDFPDRPEQLGRMLFHDKANPHGMFDVRLMRDVVVITAAGVGGGSLVYANVQLRAPAEVFEQEPWPAAITRAALDPYYDRTEHALDPRPTPDEPELAKLRTFAAAGAHINREAKRLPIAVHFGAPRTHPFSGVPQHGCENLARCDLGCPLHAKNTVDITYLARAEALGAEVYPLHLATQIDPPGADGGRWRLAFRDLGYHAAGVVEAPVLVLAAGALGSPRLLLANRRRLSRLSPALGSRFSGNGDALGIASDPQAEDVRGSRNDFGPVMTSALDFTADRRLMLADGGLPANWDVLLDVARNTDVLRGWRRALVWLRALTVRAGWSDQAMHPREVKLKPRPLNSDALVFLMFGRDAADGQMRLTPLLRRFDIRWSKRNSEQLFADLSRTAHEVADGSRAELTYALDGGPLGKFMTVHPLGGAPMADDPAHGVVDDAGRVHGYAALYVLDGSIVPSALGVNPSKTIAALAERGVEKLVSTL